MDIETWFPLAVGHEDRGLSAAVTDAADQIAFIPQLGRIGSLNVATATAVVLFELVRRRAARSAGDASR